MGEGGRVLAPLMGASCWVPVGRLLQGPLGVTTAPGGTGTRFLCWSQRQRVGPRGHMPLQWHTSHLLEHVVLLTTFTRCPLLSEAVLVDPAAPQGSVPGVWSQLRPSSLPGCAPGWMQTWGAPIHPCSPQPRAPCRAPQSCTAASAWAHEVCPSLPLRPRGLGPILLSDLWNFISY